MANLEQLARNLATKISQSNDSKIEAAKTATINQVKTEVVETAIKENLNVSNMDALATDEEVENILKGYVKTSDIFKNGYFYSKKDTDNGSYALIFNESDGGGSQYLNSSKDILSYVGTNDGDENGVCVQIYSKFKGETSNNIPNKGVRINVNPNGAFYTKGTNTSATGGSATNEIAVKGDVETLQSRIIVLESLVHALQLALANAVDANGNSVYTVPNQ